MTAIKSDGKKLASQILDDLKQKVLNHNEVPSLAVILANNNPASSIYVSKKETTAKALGFNSTVYKFDSDVRENEIIELINKLNNDPKVNAILVQLPVFDHLNEQKLIEAINPIKDVDGFHPVNLGKLLIGVEPYSIACTPKGIIRLLKENSIEIEGKNAVVVGRSNIVGKPLAVLLTKENATVTLAHSKTKNLAAVTKQADILISAVGAPNLITKDMVKQGAIVIDVGINRVNDKLVGDVNYPEVSEVAGFITPVPGGVGPMTVASLMENTYEMFLFQKDVK